MLCKYILRHLDDVWDHYMIQYDMTNECFNRQCVHLFLIISRKRFSLTKYLNIVTQMNILIITVFTYPLPLPSN